MKKRTEGLSVFLVDMREAKGRGLQIRPIRTMINHSTTEIFFDDLEIPADSLIGEEGRGFRYILDGMNAERVLIASECIGDARWFIDRASRYATERHVFGRPIGRNQGIQFPIAEAYAATEAAALMCRRAAELFESGEPCGAEANMAKLLASEASWKAADTCMQTHGGFAFAEEYDVERKFPRDEALPDRSHLEQPRAELPRGARSGPASLVLSASPTSLPAAPAPGTGRRQPQWMDPYPDLRRPSAACTYDRYRSRISRTYLTTSRPRT